MAENTPTEGTSALPPKLDLRKSGILKSAPPMAAAAPAPAPVAAPAAAPAAAATPPAPKIMPMGAPRPAPIGSPGAAPAAPGAGPSLMRPRPPTPGGLKPLGGSSPSQRPTIGVKPAAPAAAAPAAVPAAAPVAAPAAAPTVRPLVSKKETARIPLAAAKPRVEAPAESAADGETAADAPLSAIKITKPVDTVRVPIIPKPSDVVSAEKRKTSRISLEAVLSDSPSDADGEGLKTIRLKKPGEATAATVTAKPAVGGEDSSATQRKTVVVKRSAEPAGARKLTFARPAGAEGAADAAAAAGAAAQPDFAGAAPAPHVTFGVLAIVASLVMVVVIYMLCAQVLGPNSSMTRYSYAPGGPNLGWPGKMDRIQ
jgi:hypothetical protein